MSKMILIIEDEESIQNIIKAFLEDAGYTVVLAADGMEGIEQFRANKPDLVLLDLMLPKIDGFAVCEILRKESRVPIIMLTALDDDDSQMKGFDALADDYITKPFSMPVVMKHIEAVLRRAEQGGAAPNNVIRYKEITVDTDSLTVLVGTESVSLTTREFEILKLLLENQGRVVSRERLLDTVWGYDYIGDEKTKIPESVFVRAGYSANASIVTDSREGVLTLPESTIQFEEGKPCVYILTSPEESPEQTFEKRDVTLGLSDGVNIEIVSGVTETDKVRNLQQQSI